VLFEPLLDQRRAQGAQGSEQNKHCCTPIATASRNFTKFPKAHHTDEQRHPVPPPDAVHAHRARGGWALPGGVLRIGLPSGRAD
jgi:hypothetical protein